MYVFIFNHSRSLSCSGTCDRLLFSTMGSNIKLLSEQKQKCFQRLQNATAPDDGKINIILRLYVG